MESEQKTEPKDIQIPNNNFRNTSSEYLLLNTLNSSAGGSAPYYAAIDVTTGDKDLEHLTYVGIKSSQALTFAYFQNSQFKNFEKFSAEKNPFEDLPLTCFHFRKNPNRQREPPSVILGYRNGLISHVSHDKQLIQYYNCEDKRREKGIFKSLPVMLIKIIPDTSEDEVLVVFADSSIMKYKLSLNSHNLEFSERLKAFEAKINFKELRFSKKDKTNCTFGSYFKENTPEFNFYYAHNDPTSMQNPCSFYKFNHPTISDLEIKKHKIFGKIFQYDKNQDLTILAFVSLKGYLIIYEFSQMQPLLSFKSAWGGFNALSFSESCELIALAGQDDHITVLDLVTMRTLRCEGHRSFVSRAIFHSIPEERVEEDLNVSFSGRKSAKSKKYERIVAGGLDSFLSFWEFDRNIFSNGRESEITMFTFPLRRNQSEMMNDSITIQPLVMHQKKEAIGTLMIYENMLFVSDLQGAISIYLIQDFRGNLDDQFSPLKRRKGDSPSEIAEITTSESSLSKLKEWKARRVQQQSRESEDDQSGRYLNERPESSQARETPYTSFRNEYQREPDNYTVLTRRKPNP